MHSQLSPLKTNQSKSLHTLPLYTIYPSISETQLVNPIYRWPSIKSSKYTEWYIYLPFPCVLVSGIKQWGLPHLVNKLMLVKYIHWINDLYKHEALTKPSLSLPVTQTYWPDGVLTGSLLLQAELGHDLQEEGRGRSSLELLLWRY